MKPLLKIRLRLNSLTHVSDAICQKGFCILDDFLCKEHYDHLQKIIKDLFQNGFFRQAKIGLNQQLITHDKTRKDDICWVNHEITHEAMKHYLYAIKALALELNQTLFLSLINFEAHFSIYKPGAFYKKHIDQFITKTNRRISCVYYLNDSWKKEHGGELSLFDQHDEVLITIAPIANRLVLFLSNIPHEVQITSETRYSITGWLSSRSLGTCDAMSHPSLLDDGNSI